MSLHADPPPRLVREPTGVQYLTADQLGKGGFAICYRAEECEGSRQTGKIFALKIVRSQMEPQKLAQKFVTELQLHSKLRHPNIVEFYRAFSFEKSTYVVLEICNNGSLADAIKKRKFFTMPEIRRLLIQTCGAVKYLHHRNVVHRDLKTGNIFLDANMNVKVGDFGLAAVLLGKNDMGLRRTTMCGTPNYLAPEILEKTGRGHNEKVDLWAIGIIAYTLAVGKAPFHAAKREEIYKKLQNREYEWPDLSKHQNDISNDLRDLVGSLLVDEDDRPNPDQIVSHSFFKTSFIPDHLDSSCKAIKPSWPHTRPPSAETIRRGYSESWFKLCKESGVGEYAPGRMFPVVGLVNCSLVKDVEREIKAGKAPSVPIAQGTVYLPFISERKDKNKAGTNLSEIVEESSAGSSGAGSHLMEISANDRVARPLRTIKAVPSKRFKENMNPIASDNERPETAVRVQRPDTALRRARSNRGRTENTKKIDPVLQHSTRTYKPSSAMGGQALLTPPNEAEPEIRREPLQSVADEARALFARLDAERAAEKAVENSSKAANTLPDPPRPTNTRSRTASQQETRESETRKPPVRPRPRGRVASNENQHIEAILPPTIANTHTERPIRPNAIPVPVESKTLTIAPQRRGDRKAQVAETVRTMRRPAERPMSPQEPKSASPEDIADASVRNTDPTTVLAMATNLRNNLLETLSGKVPTTKGKEKPQALPFVTKWVDYAKKHGIGYVLSDGTVGCVFIATDDLPARHVIVRNGPSHLSAISADSLSKISMASLPLEFYSIGSTDSIKPMQFEGEQKKANGLLWAKFARYMCSSLSGTSERSATPDEGGATDNIMVRYYQRLGNVGVWGFSNGCYQVNFPDHTKLVISADGKQCSFTCLPLEGISHLQSTGDLPLKYVRQRAVLNGSAYALIYDHVDQSLAVANMLHLKLQYILDLVSLWVEGGGLGCRPRNKQWPKWTGAQLEESTGRKVDWITVGRFGREAVVVERAPKD